MKSIFSQSEHPNFENFLVELRPDPLNTLKTHKNFIVVWKNQGILSFLETGHPVNNNSCCGSVKHRFGPEEKLSRQNQIFVAIPKILFYPLYSVIINSRIFSGRIY